jgi:DNA repair and recombination protein RAD54B
MGTGKIIPPLYEGKNLSIASKEIELERTIPREQFLSGLSFGQRSQVVDSTSSTFSKNPVKKFNPPTFKASALSRFKLHSLAGETSPDPGSSGVQERKLLEVTNKSEHWAANW